jgi:hypothetical protein
VEGQEQEFQETGVEERNEREKFKKKRKNRKQLMKDTIKRKYAV